MNAIHSFQTYKEAAEVLGKRDSIKVAHNTWLEKEWRPQEQYYGLAPTLRLLYHRTYIVEYDPDGSIKIDCDDWLTSTTKARLNEFTPFSFSGSCYSGFASAPRQWGMYTYYGGREAENAGENWELHASGESYYYMDGMRMIRSKDGWKVRYPK